MTTIVAVRSSVLAHVVRLTWLSLLVALMGRRITVMATIKMPRVNRTYSLSFRFQDVLREKKRGIGTARSNTSVTILRTPTTMSCS